MANEADDDASGASKESRASEREALWEASALSPATALPEAALSPGARAALDHIFGEEEQPHLRQVAERGVAYGAEAQATPIGEGLATLAAHYGLTLETLAARLDLPVEIAREPFADCPPALLAEVARALRAPLAEVALALCGSAETDMQDTRADRSFAEIIRMAPSLSEEQRRHWLALLVSDPG